jgi:hypothetical protein
MLAFAVLLVLLPMGLAAQKKGRDLSKYDACKILAPADVSAATKQKIVSSVGDGPHCSYVVEALNSGSDTYDFYLNEAPIIEALFEVKSTGATSTPVPGLWTEAYVGPSVGSAKQLSLIALHKGDIAIEVQGPSQDVLIALARVATARLK